MTFHSDAARADPDHVYRALMAAGWLAAHFGYSPNVAAARRRFEQRGIDDDQKALEVIVWMLTDQNVLA